MRRLTRAYRPVILSLSFIVPLISPAARPCASAVPSSTNPGDNVLSVSGDTVWVNAHAANECPPTAHHGGQATGGPDGFETWCFEGGPGDSTSDGRPGSYTFNSFDRGHLRDDLDSLYWHVDTFQAVSGKSIWCGGWNDRVGSWHASGGGYGNYWNQIMQLTLPGPFNATRGCSLRFQARYTLDCDQPPGHHSPDLVSLEYYSYRRGEWRVIDGFSGKSGCTALIEGLCYNDWNNYWKPLFCPSAPYGNVISYPLTTAGSSSPRDFPAYPYVNGRIWVLIPGDSIADTPAAIPDIRLRWRFESDAAISTQDGSTRVHGFWVDDIAVKVGTYSYSENFNSLPVGAVPGLPYSFPPSQPTYDGWAIRHDLDPPLEGVLSPSPGDSSFATTCRANDSWQWSLVDQDGIIPPPDLDQWPARYMALLTAPAIPVNYADEEGGPFITPGILVQFDDFVSLDARTCDQLRLWVRTHRTSGIDAWSGLGVWSPWIDPRLQSFAGEDVSFTTTDATLDLSSFSLLPGVDSIQVGWASVDSAFHDSWASWGVPDCWNPTLPPHVGTQAVVDNISVGLVDASGPRVRATSRDGLFQDAFNLKTCLHTANVGNAVLGDSAYRLQNGAESLNVEILDPDGLTPGNVQLHFSFDGFATEAPGSPVAMRLSVPDPLAPGSGGIWRTTVCDTPWTPGTEISYYMTIEDDLGNVAYAPASADPSASPRQFLTVDILPTPGARILLVDDAEQSAPFYHPCRQDTVVKPVEDFYESVLADLGYGFMQSGGYDLYDVNAASGTQRINEPWGFWVANPASPDTGFRAYQTVIWTTGTQGAYTIQDTTQTFLKQFVFHGGSILVTGDGIGEDLSDPSTAQDPDFYGNLLGGAFISPHAGIFANPDRFPAKATGAPGSTLAPGDSLHLYAGCDAFRSPMDKIRPKTSLPTWSHPRPYLTYDDVTSPYDSLAGIYSYITFTADTGKVVYLPFSLDAVVDHHKVTCDPPDSPFESVGLGTFNGHAELLKDILEAFGAAPRTMIEPGGAHAFINALRPMSPNPMLGAGMIRFSLANAARASVAIFDVAGRRVATLVDRDMEAGEHAVRWSGRDATGEAVAPGVYFARMETEGFSDTKKLLMVR